MFATIGRALHTVSTRTGLARIAANSSWRRNRLLVLSYHGVSLADEHEWDPELYISPITLMRRLERLAQMGGAVLSLEEAVRRLYDGIPPGMRSDTDVRRRILRFQGTGISTTQIAPGYPATVYVTTKRSTPMLQLISSYLFWKHRHTTLDARGIEGLDRVYQLAPRADRNCAVEDILARKLRDSMEPADDEAFTREVMERLDIDYDGVLISRIPGVR